MMIALDFYTDEVKEVAAIQGKAPTTLKAFLENLHQQFQPNLALASDVHSKDFPELLKGKSAIHEQDTYYVCFNQTCEAPTVSESEALKAIQNAKTYPLE